MTYDSIVLAEPNLKAFYILAESSGNIAYDATSNHYDATASSGVVWGQPGAMLDADTSAYFSASASLTLPYNLNITTFSALTVEFWIKLTGGWQYVVITTDGTVGNTILYLNSLVYSGGGSGDIIEIAGLFDMIGSAITGGYLAKVAIYNYVLSPVKPYTSDNYAEFTMQQERS